MRLAFFGATQTVTGSRYLLTSGGRRFLVDCGLFQGFKHLRLKNWSKPLFEPRSVEAVLLTHAHLDHSGYLPLLVRDGFTGSIYATQATVALCRILLPDSGRLQEEQAQFANRHGFSKHSPALPLYTEQDAYECLKRFKAVSFDETLELGSGVRARWSRAGHLLGAGSIRVEHGGKSVLFSGDLGRQNDPLMRAPDAPPTSDYVVIESTYGDRAHPATDPAVELRDVILRTCERRGVILVPTFAVGRAQLLLHLIALLKRAGEIPDLPVYLDSPMAIDATELMLKFANDHRLSKEDAAELGRTAWLVRSVEDSKLLDRIREPAIILSASGMATGGRILHHLRRFLPEAQHTVLLVGYQASGTRGRALQDGTDELKIHGQYVTVRAQIAHIDGLSAHADYFEMIGWLERSALSPKRVFVVHGEPGPADALRRRLRDSFSWDVRVPEFAEVAELT